MKNRNSYFLSFIVIVIFFSACQDSRDIEDYKYTLQIISEPSNWFSGECNNLDVKITNSGKIPWIVSENNIKWRVRASYHIYKDSKLVCEGIRTDFIRTVKPGKSVFIRMNIYIPPEPGTYEVVLDLLKESKFWFKDSGNKPVTLIVNGLDPLASATISAKDKTESSNFDLFLSNSNKMNSRFRLSISYPEVIKVSEMIARNFEKNFKNNKSTTIGWVPGSNYPEIWLRDSYYQSLAGNYFYNPEIIRRLVENFLDYSSLRRDFIPDFISEEGETADYSVSSDKYPMIILLACEYLKQSGDSEWLRKKMGKTTIYGMLSVIVEKLFRKIYDEKSGLYFSAHTADWGDVEFEDEGAESQKIGRDSHRIAGIYTQSLFYAALKEWADVLYQGHLYQNSMQNMHRADRLKIRVNEALWNNKSGFFRIHMHLDTLKHNFNENKIFALGGNIWAIRSGIADDEQTRKILNKINNIQIRNRYPTISKVLQPSYPKDFFKNISLAEPDTYQNGGFWDWYGGLAVLEEFRHKDYEKGLRHLREISASVAANGNLFEWYDKTGRGQGSMHYLASGVSIFDAIVRGYYGIDLYGRKWTISPAFDDRARSVFYRKSESALLIAYHISPNISKRTVNVQYDLLGQDAFQFTLPLLKINVNEYEKRKNSYDKKHFFFDNRSSFLFYSDSLSPGRGDLKIRY
jgi:hypothetical protein